jgi:hypothetical protein
MDKSPPFHMLRDRKAAQIARHTHAARNVLTRAQPSGVLPRHVTGWFAAAALSAHGTQPPSREILDWVVLSLVLDRQASHWLQHGGRHWCALSVCVRSIIGQRHGCVNGC